MHAFCRTYLPDWPNYRPWIWGSQSLKVGALRYYAAQAHNCFAAFTSAPSIAIEDRSAFLGGPRNSSTQTPAPGHLKPTMSASVTTELEQAIANSTITDEDLAMYRRDGCAFFGSVAQPHRSSAQNTQTAPSLSTPPLELSSPPGAMPALTPRRHCRSFLLKKGMYTREEVQLLHDIAKGEQSGYRFGTGRGRGQGADKQTNPLGETRKS